jgi:hypothetical protein
VSALDLSQASNEQIVKELMNRSNYLPSVIVREVIDIPEWALIRVDISVSCNREGLAW